MYKMLCGFIKGWGGQPEGGGGDAVGKAEKRQQASPRCGFPGTLHAQRPGAQLGETRGPGGGGWGGQPEGGGRRRGGEGRKEAAGFA